MHKTTSLFIIATCAALSGLLFGYDAGIISGALLFIKQAFPITYYEEGCLVAMVPIGALLSSIVSGELSDLFGRKKTLFITAVFFILGSLLCAIASSITLILIGRLIIGIAIGIGSSISPVYTSELADEKQRGWLVSLFVVFIQLGVFISFVIGYAYSFSGNWRYMIGLGVFPAFLLLIGVFLLPESPRWLVAKNRLEEALKILARIYPGKLSEKKLNDIEDVAIKDKITFLKLFKEKRYLKVIFIGVAVSFFTQTVGINAFNYYAPTIFQKTGFATPDTATFYTMFMGLMLVVSTISSLFFIDKIGRKKPLLIGTVGILLTLLSITLAFTFVTNPIVLGWIFLISAVTFMAFHGISIGPACFLIPAEIFPLRVRGLGMGISVAFNWGANVVVASLVPIVISSFGVSTLFSAFFIVTIVALIVFYFYIPETKGTTLEQIERNVLANAKCVDLGKTTVKRYGSTIKLHPNKIEEYIKLHQKVWPEVLAILSRYNVKNYSIFLKDHWLFSYLEYHGDNYHYDMEQVANHEATKRWWKFTEPCQDPLVSRKEGEWWATMQEVFHLE